MCPCSSVGLASAMSGLQLVPHDGPSTDEDGNRAMPVWEDSCCTSFSGSHQLFQCLLLYYICSTLSILILRSFALGAGSDGTISPIVIVTLVGIIMRIGIFLKIVIDK